MIYFHCAGTGVDSYYLDLAKFLESKDFSVSISDDRKFLNDILAGDNHSNYSNSTVIIIDLLYNKFESIELLNALSKGSFVDRKVRVIVISTLLTWCGQQTQTIITSINDELMHRCPNKNYHDIYLLENSLLAFNSNALEVAVIGRGLLYGNKGYDFQSILEALYNNSTIPINDPGNNIFPCIHIEDFFNIVYRTIAQDEIENPYIVASDFSNSSLTDIISLLASQFSITKINYTDIEGSLQYFLEQPVRSCLFSSNLYFSKLSTMNEDMILQNYRNGISTDNVVSLVADFKRMNNLEPLKVAFVGIALSGKTTFARDLAEKCGLSYVDSLESLKFTVNSAAREDVDDKQVIASLLRTEIIASIKGGYQQDTKTLHLLMTDALLKSLSTDLIRKCISYMLSYKTTCVSRGYVLDVWNTAISNVNDYHMVLSRLIYNDLTKSYEIVDQTPMNGSSKNNNIDMIVELVVTETSGLAKRFLTALGHSDTAPNKLPKDIQTQIKAIDASIASYTSKLSVVENISILSQHGVQLGTCVSHEQVRSLETELGVRVLRVQIDPTKADSRGVSDAIVMSLKSARAPDEYIPSPELLEAIDPALATTADGLEGEAHTQVEEIDDLGAQEAVKVFNEESHPTDSFESLQAKVKGLDEGLQRKLIDSSDQLMDVLLELILPHVAEGYVKISREKPDDPIQYMADFLHQRGTELEESARAEAENEFHKALHEANGREHR